ncbi:unnamed protein product, partial [Phaeothamnion confervicola]
VTPNVRNRLAGHLCRRLKLTTGTLRRLATGGSEGALATELALPDCSRIEPQQMEATLLECRESLEVLRLGTCGCCFTDHTAAALVKAGGMPRLETLSLHGCYRLSDTSLASLLRTLPALRAVELPCDSRLGRAGLAALAEGPLGGRLTGLSVNQCDQLDAADLQFLGSFPALEILRAAGLPALTDAVLEAALARCGKSLRLLDIEDCEGLTDASLTAVRRHCGSLTELHLGMNPSFSNEALLGLFAFKDAMAAAAKAAQAEAAAAAAA